MAILIAGSIVKDGVSNLRAAVGGLLDKQATTYDDTREHPLLTEVRSYFAHERWVRAAEVRMRDEGHVFHTEVFVIPRDEQVDLGVLERARDRAASFDWKLKDLVVIPVRRLPGLHHE